MSEILKLNPLYTIFEKHLYDFNDTEETAEKFIGNILNDYLKFLEAQKVTIPQKWRSHIEEELRDQIQKMMVKKMYGCLSIQEYIINQKDKKQKQRAARKKYSKLF